MTKHTANRNHPNRSKRLSALETSHAELLALAHHVLYCERQADELRGAGMVDNVDIKVIRALSQKATAAIARAESLTTPTNRG